ncbi:MAG TPA: hypothetical protein VHH36_02255 [Candidatus Thermoplasmatota archaeon]|nr:hypothetical protein [Candidatus Thermoplasmatota archaeon]
MTPHRPVAAERSPLWRDYTRAQRELQEARAVAARSRTSETLRRTGEAEDALTRAAALAKTGAAFPGHPGIQGRLGG